MTRFVEVHALQPFPFSCVNRDDTNLPKSMSLGGARRARWSSQSQKRRVRLALQTHLGRDAVSTRTRRLGMLVIDKLAEDDTLDPAEINARVLAVMKAMKVKLSSPKAEAQTAAEKGAKDEPSAPAVEDEKTKVLPGTTDWNGLTQVIIPVHSSHAVAGIAEVVLEHWDALGEEKVPAAAAKAAAQAAAAALDATRLVDVALFGRMLSEVPSESVEAAASVAHAFTTHPDEIEMDFWSAVDDRAVDQGHGGSANMGSQAFTSGCFYRYAVVDLDTLRNPGHPLAEDEQFLRSAVTAFLADFARLRPTAMAHSTAPYVDPAVVVVAATDQPRHLGDAFIRPVGADYLAESARRLQQTWDAWAQAYESSVQAHYVLAHPDVQDASLGEATGHVTLTEAVEAAVGGAFGD